MSQKWRSNSPISFQLWTNSLYNNNCLLQFTVNFRYWFNNLMCSSTGQRVCVKFNLSYQTSPEFLKPARTHVLPIRYGEWQCVAMILANLAQPEWVSVPCDVPLLGDVMCERKGKQTLMKNVFLSYNQQICQGGTILMANSCYLFCWTDIGRKPQVEGGKLMSINTSEYLKKFEPLLKAIDVTFPNFLIVDRIAVISFVGYSDLFKYIQKPVRGIFVGGLLVYTTGKHTVYPGSNVFQCLNNSSNSYAYVCDGYIDCHDGGSDEKNCLCSSTEEIMCKWIKSESGRPICSKYFFLSLNGTCELYYFGHHKLKSSAIDEKYKCKNGRIFSKSLVNDLVSDCGPQTEDEPQLKLLLHDMDWLSCLMPAQLPCKEGHPKCYSISDICSYHLDKHGFLVPCRTGGNLHNCEKFECNVMSKCPEYYCIPWFYICDGRWDCPDGTDESQLHTCGDERQVSFQYKCKDSQIHIHLSTICDESRDCPLGDDEIFCDLNIVLCPSKCSCLVYTLYCFNHTLSPQELADSSPHKVFLLTRCTLTAERTFFQKIQRMKIFVGCQLGLTSDFCSILPKLLFIVIFQLRQSTILAIKTGCFSNLKVLKIISLENNNVSNIDSKAFSNLTSLNTLILRENSLVLATTIIILCENLVLLSIQSNTSLVFSQNTLTSFKGKMIVSNEHSLCCVVPSSVCFSRKVWHIDCANLLMHPSLTIATSIVLFLLVSCSLFSSGLQVKTDKEVKTQVKGYSITVVFTNMTDASLFLYLSILCTADIVYSNTYYLSNDIWMSNPFCYFSGFIHLNFCLLSPVMFSFLSLSRMMVTLQPMTTVFKQTGFVSKCLGCIVCVSCMFSLGPVLTIWIQGLPMPFRLCSLFENPVQTRMTQLCVVWLFTTLHVFLLCAAVVMSIKLATRATNSHKNVMPAAGRNGSTKNTMVHQLVVLLSACALAWCGTDTVNLLALYMPGYPIKLIMWSRIVVLPFAPFVISCVFIATNVRKLSKKG